MGDTALDQLVLQYLQKRKYALPIALTSHGIPWRSACSLLNCTRCWWTIDGLNLLNHPVS